METRILIVDDDPFICRQLEELYTAQQYTVSSAGNAQEGLRLLAEQDSRPGGGPAGTHR